MKSLLSRLIIDNTIVPPGYTYVVGDRIEFVYARIKPEIWIITALTADKAIIFYERKSGNSYRPDNKCSWIEKTVPDRSDHYFNYLGTAIITDEMKESTEMYLYDLFR